MIELKGQSVIVTGGANGIGKAICLEFAKAGANITVADLNFAKSEVTASEAKEFGVDAIAVKVDVSNEASVNAMVEAAYNKFGKIDVLINNAGICELSSVEEMKVEDWDRMMAVNLRSVFLGAKAVIPYMKKQGHGKIQCTASQYGKVGAPQYAHYCASKAGVILFTRSLALELAKDNILVNCICPGNVYSDMTVREATWIMEKTGKPVEETIKEWEEVVPIGRYAYPLDVARMHLLMASEYADYCTGDAVNVAGGLTMI